MGGCSFLVCSLKARKEGNEMTASWMVVLCTGIGMHGVMDRSSMGEVAAAVAGGEFLRQVAQWKGCEGRPLWWVEMGSAYCLLAAKEAPQGFGESVGSVCGQPQGRRPRCNLWITY